MSELDLLSINTLRFLAVDAVEKAKSGHPGAPLGDSPTVYLLFHEFMRHNPVNSKWSNRDRFVLSNGHASAMLYAVLHLTGYKVGIDDLMQFRQYGSITPGHPEYGDTDGVEVTTGPLGQGFAMGVGMAIAEKHLAAIYNRPGYDIVDHYTYVMCGDGDLMEGVSHEAASLAGTLGLGKMIYFYDDNLISLDGPTALSFTEDVTERFAAYHWHVQMVDDANDLEAISLAIKAAQAVKDQPSLIRIRTVIGYGSPRQAPTKHMVRRSGRRRRKKPRRSWAGRRTRASTCRMKRSRTGCRPWTRARNTSRSGTISSPATRKSFRMWQRSSSACSPACWPMDGKRVCPHSRWISRLRLAVPAATSWMLSLR
jgi:transketolase